MYVTTTLYISNITHIIFLNLQNHLKRFKFLILRHSLKNYKIPPPIPKTESPPESANDSPSIFYKDSFCFATVILLQFLFVRRILRRFVRRCRLGR